MQLIEVDSFADSGSLLADASPRPPSTCSASPAADASWQVMDRGVCTSQCALWWRSVPALPGHRVGIIGCFAASEEHSTKALLGNACEKLRAEGCTLAVGPMDGNTWGNYRFVTEFGERSQFWMEPNNPATWPQFFVRCGFRPLANYFSAVNTELDYRDVRLDSVARRFADSGIHLRPICGQSFDQDLRQIYDVARIAFRSNLLYTDLGLAAFYRQTRPLRQLVPLELSWIAERSGQVLGFLFAIPDFYEQARGERPSTIVIKTLGTMPERRCAGLGQLLLAKAHQQALENGFTQAIHALVYDRKSLRRISARYARQMRGYTLFAKELTP